MRLSLRAGEVARAFSAPRRAFDPDISESIVNQSPGGLLVGAALGTAPSRVVTFSHRAHTRP